MKRILFFILIYIISASYAFAITEIPEKKHKVFLIDDAPFAIHKSHFEEIRNSYAEEEDEFGLDPHFNKSLIEKILPSEAECEDLNRPLYLLDNVTTKYFEKGPLDSFHTGFVFKGSVNMNLIQGGSTHIDETYSMIENDFRGYFKNGKTSFFLSTRYPHRSDVSFMQFLIGNAFISHQYTPHNRIVIGNSRTHSGEEGSKQVWLVPFMNYSQIGRNFGNIRKLGARVIGDYDLVEYDFGGYSSGSYFRSFFPGAEFTGWVNLKPLGKTDGRYGDLKVGGGLSSGHNGFTYNVAGAYARYEYKKFKVDFEYANADGYNGNLGLSQNHASGFYTSAYYKINPKVELLARYDCFQPNRAISHNDIKEYVVGLNYYLKGQGLRFILNYIFRQNSSSDDSHRIILGTQIML